MFGFVFADKIDRRGEQQWSPVESCGGVRIFNGCGVGYERETNNGEVREDKVTWKQKKEKEKEK